MKRPDPSTTSNQRTFSRRGALGALSAGLLSCSPVSNPEPRFVPRPLRTSGPLVVVIAIDGVRYQDVFLGSDRRWGGDRPHRSREQLVPSLMRIEEKGAVLGAPGWGEFSASGPSFVSLPGYMEMLSGIVRQDCTENQCKTMSRQTVMDDIQTRTPDDPSRSAVIASWHQLQVAAAKHRRGVVSAGRFDGSNMNVLEHFPGCRRELHRGRSSGGGEGPFRHDAITGDLALSYFEEALPEFLFVSIGETDERAHEGNYQGYLDALRAADRFVGAMDAALRDQQVAGRDTLLIVTTDHGRARNFQDHGRTFPESGRGFLFATGSMVPRLGRLYHAPAYLKNIAPTVRKVHGLPPAQEQGASLDEVGLPIFRTEKA